MKNLFLTVLFALLVSNCFAGMTALMKNGVVITPEWAKGWTIQYRDATTSHKVTIDFDHVEFQLNTRSGARTYTFLPAKDLTCTVKNINEYPEIYCYRVVDNKFIAAMSTSEAGTLIIKSNETDKTIIILLYNE